jgi:hypothetical protein
LSSKEEAAMADYVNDVLVDTQWVQDHLDDPGVRIVEVDENPALYAEAHIPGAIGFDWKRDLQDQVKRDFLGPGDFGALFGARGSRRGRSGLAPRPLAVLPERCLVAQQLQLDLLLRALGLAPPPAQLVLGGDHLRHVVDLVGRLHIRRARRLPVEDVQRRAAREHAQRQRPEHEEHEQTAADDREHVHRRGV